MGVYYDNELVMPSNYVVMDEQEMTYLEGGASCKVYGTTKSIRNRLSAIIVECVAGDITAATLVATGGVLTKILAGVAASWFTNVLSKASAAHNKVEGYITKYGKSRSCTMTSTWSTIVCTGISVAV